MATWDIECLCWAQKRQSKQSLQPSLYSPNHCDGLDYHQCRKYAYRIFNPSAKLVVVRKRLVVRRQGIDSGLMPGQRQTECEECHDIHIRGYVRQSLKGKATTKEGRLARD